MNNNRSGTSELHMSVRKFRAKIHEAYKAGHFAGASSGEQVPTADNETERREYVNQAVKDLNWR
jgi:hypothetical protein